jgi:LysR family transcriptional regulator, transcriptional activator of the cysJI operon
VEPIRLRVFRIVAEELSFTRAAERLFLTQPAVTMQIKNLEVDLGLRLFDRTGQRIVLTPAGAILKDYARRICLLCTDAERDLAALKGETRGRLALGASTTIAQYLLPRLAAEFLAAFPAIQLSIISGNTSDIVAALAEGRIALGLIEGPCGRNDVKCEEFVEDEIVLVVPPAHEFATGGALDPATLKLASIILREHGSGTRQVVEDALKRARLDTRKLHIVLELDSTESIKSAISAGLGVGFVSRWALGKEIALGLLRTVPVKGLRILRHFQFVYLQGPVPGGVEGEFLRFAGAKRADFDNP